MAASTTISQLETARRYNINLVVLVNNNSGLNQEITLNKLNYAGRPLGKWTNLWTFTDNNFAKIAEAFGCGGIRVEKPGDIKDALKQAFAMNKPVVIDVVSDVNVLAKRVPT